jgi:hypothetical protein
VAGIFVNFPISVHHGNNCLEIIDEKAGTAKNPGGNWPGVKTFLLETHAKFKGLRQERLDKRIGF